MTRMDFTGELDRLANGFKQEMTPERAEAIWQAIRHRSSLSAWRDAVDRALLDPRFPTGDRLLRFVDEAAEGERKQRYAERPATEGPAIVPSRREYAEFRLQLLERISKEHLSPDAVARILTEAKEFFQPEAGMIAAEVETLRGRERWADVPAVSAS